MKIPCLRKEYDGPPVLGRPSSPVSKTSICPNSMFARLPSAIVPGTIASAVV